MLINIVVILLGVVVGTTASVMGYGCATWQYWVLLISAYGMYLLGCYKGLKEQ